MPGCRGFNDAQPFPVDVVHPGQVQGDGAVVGCAESGKRRRQVASRGVRDSAVEPKDDDRAKMLFLNAKVPNDPVVAAHRGVDARGRGGCGWDKLTNFRDVGVYLMDDSGDAAAIARCLDGYPEEYEAIVSRYQRRLFNVALRMLGNYEDARDATQNAFVKAYEHLDSYDPGQRFFSWLFRILKNECLNVLRARRPSQPVSLDLPTARGADPVEVRERQHAIQTALLSLSTEYREVVVLRHFTDLSYDEIAATLGIPATKVKSRLYTARQQLGELLIDWRVAR